MPSRNFTLRLAPFAPVAAARADPLDSVATVVPTAPSDEPSAEPSAAAPAARCRKSRRGSFTTICPQHQSYPNCHDASPCPILAQSGHAFDSGLSDAEIRTQTAPVGKSAAALCQADHEADGVGHQQARSM